MTSRDRIAIVVCLVLSAIVSYAFIRAAAPDVDTSATWTAVRTVDGHDYVTDSGLSSSDCFERMTRNPSIFCERE